MNTEEVLALIAEYQETSQARQIAQVASLRDLCRNENSLLGIGTGGDYEGGFDPLPEVEAAKELADRILANEAALTAAASLPSLQDHVLDIEQMLEDARRWT